ncbi:uncharacterized protein LOC132625981 isoform X2 [Lycium barbarum]|uniref:uncharacterized protein LOC132625981 isoform X2 n=1 Tax=Lycium barbarum TaxID=112863 RepID=UPI00293E764A|nr:uncharacterized protein LOC132625981 isoform X2 [Lycium barbarum]
MDAIVNKAIEELCIQCCKGSSNSVPIHNLWLNLKPYLSKNGISLCGTVKKAVLSNLINIPGLEFESIDCSITSRGGSTGSGLEFESKDGNINDVVKCSVEECERLDDLNIVVPKSMLDNFSRIHEVEVSKSKLSKQELEALHLRKRVLQRIAIARANGITQSELTKEFNTKANNFFHILKELQTLGLILSHQVTVWENETSNDGKLINKHISTNMLYLSLYGKHLRYQQRLEIWKRGLMADDRENVLIKDDLPSLRDICNILEKAKGKVLRISNIKKDLGYRDAAGHKRWANILRKLTQAQVVEVIEKDKFLRLLKAFSPMHFDTRKRRSDNLGREQPPTKIEKRDQIGQQIVELPIEPQTCGIIHAEGSREIRDVEYQGNNRMSTAHSSTDVSNTVNDTKMQIMMRSSVCDLVPVKTSATETISPRCQAYKAYPSHKLRADCAREQREHWILKMLEEEKFLIKPDLQRRLERLEKGRHTSMDKKTLERSLNKLQQKGHCKCLDVFFPAVTNFCENAKRVAVLHPSIYGLSPALLVKIYDRIRSFERELRGTSFSKFQKGDALPIVYDVGRGLQRIEMDVQDALVKKSRGKKSLMEKMARAKLLHIYLWEYVNSLPDSEDTSSSGKYGYDLKNDDSSCKLVDIGSAIEAMQLELFLQVSGSAHMHENVFEKCGDYLHRSGIPMKDYTCLKDTPSIKELSLLIAVLQRFKLIRLVCGEHMVDATQVTQITLTHALELKPFSSAARSSSFHGPDSCHQVRHDFVLSNRKAVDEYWNTLEYFLAGPNPEAASNASPGNDVPAVKEVLQLFHNRKQKRLSRSQGVLNSKWMVHFIKGRNNSSRKRKRSSGGVPSRHVKLRTSDVQQSDKSTCDTVEQFPDEQNAFVVSPGDIGCNSQINCVGDHREVTEGIEQWEKNEGNHSFMKRSDLSSLKPTCRAIFSWTEDADRQLVIEYVRLRAALGPYSRCFKWASVKNLPASPDACKCRMAILMKGCIQFRSALMKLCNVVSERYARYLQNRSLDCGDCEEMVQRDASEDLNQGVSDSPEHSREAAEERWDDFDVYNVKVALDKVLECKKMAKLNGSNGVQSANANSDLSINAERPEKSSHWVPKRCGHPLIESNNIRRQPFESVAVANAVELSKLAVLTTSRSQLVPTSLVETFKHYSEHDKVLAFNFLKEMKLIESRAKYPVALSGKFFDSMFSSPFPIKTGEQAAKFSTWLHEREKEMVNGGVVLPQDLQCGDVLNLCGLLSSGELSIIPCLPAKGVGKAKDARTLKRKNNITNFRDGSRGKTYRIGESEARRAKGFPDISLSLSRATFFSREAVEFFKNDENQPLTQIGEENQVKIMSVPESRSSASYLEGKNNVEEAHENGSYGYTAVSSKELLWKAMASSAEHFCSFSSKKESSAFNPELFRSLLLAIQKAGDQGLTMKEISMSVNVQGEKMLDVIIDVLETFGQVLKVNGYDSVNVVDSSYHSKYFLSTVPVNRQDSLVTLAGADDAQKELGMNAEFHNPTNREQPSEPLLERQSTNRNDSLEFQTAKSHPCKPILPWIDGDGTFNNGVYRKLVSRALGIIMQKPGILEDHVIDQMHGMNPQSCRTLLEMMILDNHIVVRKMFETIAGPPAILSGLLGTQFVKSKLILKRHLFANPTSTSHL